MLVNTAFTTSVDNPAPINGSRERVPEVPTCHGVQAIHTRLDQREGLALARSYAGSMNSEWALIELNRFLELTEYSDQPGLFAATYVGSKDAINAQSAVVERIWERVLGQVTLKPKAGNDPHAQARELTVRSICILERDAEIRSNLGELAPDLNASKLHPWVWAGARSLWQSAHFAEAVEGAAKKLNAEAQNKVQRRDVSESELFNQCFTDDPPQPGKPRLRLPEDDGGRTALSLRRGVRSFAEGCFAAIRNPVSHDGAADMEEIDALERLAALSMLARWVDSAAVLRSPSAK